MRRFYFLSVLRITFLFFSFFPLVNAKDGGTFTKFMNRIVEVDYTINYPFSSKISLYKGRAVYEHYPSERMIKKDSYQNFHLDLHVTQDTVQPSLSITYPSNNYIFPKGTAAVQVSLEVSDFRVAYSRGDGKIRYRINNEKYFRLKTDTDPITVNTSDNTAYMLEVELIDNFGFPLSPVVRKVVNFSVAGNVEGVNSISAQNSTNAKEPETYFNNEDTVHTLIGNEQEILYDTADDSINSTMNQVKESNNKNDSLSATMTDFFDLVYKGDNQSKKLSLLTTEEIAEENFSVFPNPVWAGSVTIVTPSNAMKKIELYDILGKPVLVRTIQGNLLDVSGVSNGVYILKVTQEDLVFSRKLIVN